MWSYRTGVDWGTTRVLRTSKQEWVRTTRPFDSKSLGVVKDFQCYWYTGVGVRGSQDLETGTQSGTNHRDSSHSPEGPYSVLPECQHWLKGSHLEGRESSDRDPSPVPFLPVPGLGGRVDDCCPHWSVDLTGPEADTSIVSTTR